MKHTHASRNPQQLTLPMQTAHPGPSIDAPDGPDAGQAAFRPRPADTTQPADLTAVVARMARVHALQSGISEAILRWRQPGHLYVEVCRMLVDVGGLQLAWVGRVDGRGDQAQPLALSVQDGGAAPSTTTTFAELQTLSRHLTGEDGPFAGAVQTGEPCIFRDLRRDPPLDAGAGAEPAPHPWRAQALRLGYRCMAAWPIAPDGVVSDCLVVAGARAGQLDDALVGLLSRLSRQLARALEIDTATRRLADQRESLRAATVQRGEALARVSARLARQDRRLQAVLALNQQAHGLNEAGLLRRAARALAKGSGADWVAFMVLDERGEPEPVEIWAGAALPEQVAEWSQCAWQRAWRIAWRTATDVAAARLDGASPAGTDARPSRLAWPLTLAGCAAGAAGPLGLVGPLDSGRAETPGAGRTAGPGVGRVGPSAASPGAGADAHAWLVPVIEGFRPRLLMLLGPGDWTESASGLLGDDPGALSEDPAAWAGTSAACPVGSPEGSQAAGPHGVSAGQPEPARAAGPGAPRREPSFADQGPRPSHAAPAEVAADWALFADAVWRIVSRRRTERELDAARQAAEAAQSVKSTFLANMSHEIRTPMNAITGFAHLLSLEPLTRSQHNHLRRLDAAGRQLVRVIDDILDLARIEARELPLEPEAFWLDVLLEEVARGVARPARERQLALKVCGPTGRWRVLADRYRLRQLLQHLLDNAVKFTAQGGIELSAEVLAGHQAARGESAQTLRLSVRDTGIGMDAEQIERACHAFEQADPSRTRRHGGTGTGLALVQRLVGLMQGKLQVDSQPGEGSCFTVTLPVPLATAAGQVGEPALRGPLPDEQPAAPEQPEPPSRWAAGDGGEAPDQVDLFGHVHPAAGPEPAARLAPAGQDGASDAQSAFGGVDVADAEEGEAGTAGADRAAGAQASDVPASHDGEGWLRRVARVSGLDSAAGLRCVNQQAASYHRVVLLFLDHHGADPGRLRRALLDGARERLGGMAHAIAGAAATLGALPLQRAARALQRDAEGQGALAPRSTVALSPQVHALADALETLIRALRQALAGPAAPAAACSPAALSDADDGHAGSGPVGAAASGEAAGIDAGQPVAGLSARSGPSGRTDGPLPVTVIDDDAEDDAAAPPRAASSRAWLHELEALLACHDTEAADWVDQHAAALRALFVGADAPRAGRIGGAPSQGLPGLAALLQRLIDQVHSYDFEAARQTLDALTASGTGSEPAPVASTPNQAIA